MRIAYPTAVVFVVDVPPADVGGSRGISVIGSTTTLSRDRRLTSTSPECADCYTQCDRINNVARSARRRFWERTRHRPHVPHPSATSTSTDPPLAAKRRPTGLNRLATPSLPASSSMRESSAPNTGDNLASSSSRTVGSRLANAPARLCSAEGRPSSMLGEDSVAELPPKSTQPGVNAGVVMRRAQQPSAPSMNRLRIQLALALDNELPAPDAPTRHRQWAQRCRARAIAVVVDEQHLAVCTRCREANCVGHR